MAEEAQQQPALLPVGKPLTLIPVVIKEAALDSPTFRATAVHFGEQIDIIERWLEAYVKSVSKLAQEANALETIVNNYISASVPPLQVSEAVIDHDYTVLALKRFGEGAKEFWQATLKGMKRVEVSVVDPIRSFLQNDLRMLKDSRKMLDQSQRQFDSLISRYSSQAKTKEPSSLREDAFQLHEARRTYLKASMDFCVMAPQVRNTFDKLIVKVTMEQWKDMKSARDSTSSCFAKCGVEMERVKGWSREMENGERVFKRELHMARKEIESSAEIAARPSRELDDYAASTVPYLGKQGPSTANLQSTTKPGPEMAEKQSWLFQRTITGKPARTIWVRRWFFVKNGIFGWRTQGTRSGAVEESEKIGVLLCSIRAAFQEERRFCFEVKTKDTTIVLQAETQSELIEWISAFEGAKRKALEDTARTDKPSGSQSVDAAFAISPPIAPEFAARTAEGNIPYLSDELLGIERAETLPVPGSDSAIGSLASRSSFDVSRRGTGIDKDGESSSRDHAARIIQKLDLHRKSTAGPQLTGNSPSPAAGGIASLISASLMSAGHNLIPVGQMTSPAPGLQDPRTAISQNQSITTSSLAPSTLASPPAPTNLSRAAVAVTGERGASYGRSDGDMPGGLMANLWGSMNWGYINRLERGELKPQLDRNASQPPSPAGRSSGLVPVDKSNEVPQETSPLPRTVSPAPAAHRKTMSLGGSSPSKSQRPSVNTDDFPNYYPLPLRVQDAQFRVLFPNVPRDDKVVLVFRAVWNPTDQQEFPGRVYVTAREVYFYSNHIGLVLTTGISLFSIEEVTAAPGKDCDFLFLHFKEGAREDNATRVTVKTFLEPLKLLQRRLNFLVRNAALGDTNLEDIIKTLIRMEVDDAANSPSVESWEDVSVSTPMDVGYGGKDVKTTLRIDGNLFGGPSNLSVSKNATKFKLPSHPVVYAPQGMTQVPVEKEFDISAKALFHVLFGDKSAVFQMLYRERWAQRIVQSPWVQPEQGLKRRDFEYEVSLGKNIGAAQGIVVNDYQVIEVLNDHLCYVVTDKKSPWYLPLSDYFTLVSKIVITHVGKSQCKLAIYTKVEWSWAPRFTRSLIERQGLRDLELEALDLADVVTDQVQKLGRNSHTNKAIQIFGHVGQQTQAAQFAASDIPPPTRLRRFKLQHRTLTSVVLTLVGNVVGAILSTLFGWLMAFLTAIFDVCTAHTMLIGLLLLSGGTNLFYSSRDTMEWWNERNAGKFMSRIGIGPSTSMSRTVYLHDIDNMLLNNTSFVQDPGSSKCLQTFNGILSLSSSYDPLSQHTPASALTSTSKSTRRLRRTRQNLGSYRHDLLVALRVVNRVEKEVLEAEYENWLLDETRKCGQMDAILRASDDAEGEETAGEMKGWVEEYCGSCEKELEGVRRVGGRGLL
ncbi:hypothetical protein K432DRAFT_336025 [Lepidopterella palustris CBS 459.81]|uniref:Transcription factor SipA3 n=1 Tax=Lepidopterella palustris CBS 459.81 TaxID=1314670 RepID=A0A8E2E2M8_9PEZI|nr:hypothetical protein K432DRAFT_336025 [Lepidopterella palustris CBS 459.81]